MKLEFSAGGVVYKRQENKIYFAMILDQDQKWTFPKGHIEKGEKPEEAAVREVGEEIGVPDLIAKDLLEKIEYWFVFKEEKIHKFVYYYLMEAPTNAELTPQLDEVGDAKWVESDQLLEQVAYKEVLPVVKEAFSILKI